MSNQNTIIYVNKDTFEVVVKCDAAAGFLPSEQTIAIKKYAELIKKELQEFLTKQHEPKVKKLLQMVADYNYKHNPDYAKKVDEALKAEKHDLVVVPKDAELKVDLQDAGKSATEADKSPDEIEKK